MAAGVRHMSTSYRQGIAPDKEKLLKASNYYIANPESSYDNAASLRKYLELVQCPLNVKRELLVPWDNGFYLLSDGKSHPVKWARLPSRLRALGLNLDPPAVLHDYRYYVGTARSRADKEYYNNQLALGMPQALAVAEFWALRCGGWLAYVRHAQRRESIPGYGTDRYIMAQIRE